MYCNNRHDVYVSSRVSHSQSLVFICNLPIFLGSRDPHVSSHCSPYSVRRHEKRCLIIKDFRTKNQTLWPAVWVGRVRDLPKPGFTNLTIRRDLYPHLTAAARVHGYPGIPSYLSGFSRKPRKNRWEYHTTNGWSQKKRGSFRDSGDRPGGIRLVL